MIRVTCAIIRNEDRRVLVVQRGEKTDHPFKWEFPGGKVKPGESEEECIHREIREELSIDLIICGRLEEVDYDYGHKHIMLIPFICDTPDELPLLTEHVAFRWIDPESLRDLDFSEADIVVAGNYLSLAGFNDDPGEKLSLQAHGVDEDEDFRVMLSSTMRTKEIECIAASAVEDKEIFKKLFDYTLSDNRKMAFHASWVLTKAADASPAICNNYISRMIAALDHISNESVQRSFLKIISMTDAGRLSENEHGLLADHCFTALRSGTAPVAIKAYSLEIIYRLSVIYPDLVHELSETINMLQGEASAGIVARGRIIMKQLEGLKKTR
jgi:8-oxo-dGTP diphosphatase